ncbi:MAG: tRNA lysidine(34) synthetase TilS [Alphaproteobacteria bacterium]|nr:tRNA lysidine(34) synthetase TilS [Alphaproteobacteria bacterium]
MTDILDTGRFAELLSNPVFVPHIPAGKPLGVAVSGGPDSMALCALLAEWMEHEGAGRAISALHILSVDHGLRPEAVQEVGAVGAWAQSRPGLIHAALACHPETGGPTKDGNRIMEKARSARYTVMADYCHAHNIRSLLLAHHRDDQAETLLFRLAKGSGLDGLAAMRPVQPFNDDLTLLRPLLDTPKATLIDFCETYAIPFITDPSNASPDFARPRLRKARAALEAEGLTSKRLTVTASRLARARDALDKLAGEAFEATLTDRTEHTITLDWNALKTRPEEIALRTLLIAIDALHPESRTAYGPPLEKIEHLFDELLNMPRFRKRTLHGTIFERDDKSGSLHLSREHMPKSG